MSFPVKGRARSGKVSKSKSIEMDAPSINDLPVLRRKRTLAFNRLRNALGIALAARDDPEQLNTFLAYFPEVKKLVVNFEDAHEDIIALIDSSLTEKEDLLRSEFDDVYLQVLSYHRQFTTSNQSCELNKSKESNSSSSSPNVKLPKINLPKFSGHIKSWPEFYDIFNSLIHNNESLSDTERMHYLVSSLSGDASALIRTFPLQGKFYTEAYNTLVARYKDKRELAFTCWKEILNINLKTNSPHEFRRVLDLLNENLMIMKGLNLPTEQWDFILCYLLLSKLDSKTRCAFERSHSSCELPSFNSLKDFLFVQCDTLMRDEHFLSKDRTGLDKAKQKPFQYTSSKKPVSALLSNAAPEKKETMPKISPSSSTSSPSSATLPTSMTSSTPKPMVQKCTFCQENHSIAKCTSFAQKSVEDRYQFAKTHHWCLNCLRASHQLKDCKSWFTCQICRQRHHSLLHRDSPVSVERASHLVTDQSCRDSEEPDSQLSVLTNIGGNTVVLLATANVEIRDSSGQFHTFRALIDSGSQAHFVTERVIDRLGIRRDFTSRSIRGLGQSSASVSGIAQLELGVRGKVLFNISALTLPSICGDMPAARLNIASWEHLRNLPLADPNCFKPGPIDVLIGAEIFSSLLVPGSISGSPQQPSALNTVFGWILLGNAGYTDTEAPASFFLTSEDNLLYEEVKKMWELDSFPQPSPLTPDEQRCEDFYVERHSRDISGRYSVALPFKDMDQNHQFHNSRDIALRRFHSLERKLHSNPALHEQYSSFMADYLDSGHMSRVSAKDIQNGKYYIPHHCVLRPDSSTTKLRVVFDASAKDTTGISLNDVLLVGPKLQTNIVEILLKFRIHAVVFTADIRQMYRQILIDEPDRVYQRIFWRSNQSEPIQEYQLNTVTYGVSSAPFLACRTIKQIVKDEGVQFPHSVAALSSDVYVDDVVTGCSDLPTAQLVKSDVIHLLQKGNFELRKWASNEPNLLADLPPEHCLTDVVSMDVEKSQTLKVLGLKWEPRDDIFSFEVSPLDRKCTKRTILSEVARIYDPLGFLCPLTFIPKSLVQRLWILGVGWDEIPPNNIIRQWNQYVGELHAIKSLRIPRLVSTNNIESCEIHAFCDSSEAGFGTVLYLRTTDVHGKIKISFLCAKSRVAPIKKVSLPRLELCAAVLLADVLKHVKDIYQPLLSISNTFAWSDSIVALSWIRSHSSRWKTFVGNRVSHIQDVAPGTRWDHVRSADNPADIASRGMSPSDLVQNELWWAGPAWLSRPSSCWPTDFSLATNSPLLQAEERIQSCIAKEDTNFIDSLIERFSSIRKVQRIVGYCMRFVHNVRCKQSRRSDLPLNRAELHISLMTITKRVQSHHFHEEILKLTNGKSLPKPFRKLNLFIDGQGVLRVGGRLSRSGLEYDHKFPALLPRDSKFTYMIINAVHVENCHTGINTTQYLLIQQFWILSSKRAIRHCLSKCVSCYRTKPVPLEPFMSDLPASRVNQVKAFSVVGVDYGGPFRIKLGKHRGAKISKAFLCLFVCLCTKTVHLEVASDLTSDSFIAALRRFVGRRGRVNVIHSDCGTNFIGARKLLNTYMQTASQSQDIEFKFNPPSAPHFGGVWEIQIKAAKTHLHRIVGDQVLTFEELTTLFVQIESVLNSRPLCPLSSDPNDINVLTPGHFLTLEPLTSIPDCDYSQTNITRLSRWQMIQSFHQQFWIRWKNEYLHSLTQRVKWTKHCKPLDVGSVVIIKNENTMPLHWPIARVEKLHPSPDGVVRIATVRTANGSTYTRPLTKLCPLPTTCE